MSTRSRPAADDLDAPAPGTDLVRTYLCRIGRTALLSAAEEVALAKRIEVGVYAEHLLATTTDLDPADLRALAEDGQRARTRLVEANLRLVVMLAKRYTGRGMSQLDLIQEGNIGLIRAVEGFDHARGFRFSTYAAWWIRRTISRGIAEQDRVIRLPVYVTEQVNRLMRAKRDLGVSAGREVTAEELAEAVGQPLAKVLELLGHASDALSLDLSAGHVAFACAVEQDVETVVLTELRDRDLRRGLAGLTDHERAVIRARYGLDDGVPQTVAQVARRFRVSRDRVRWTEREVIGKLRRGGALLAYAG